MKKVFTNSAILSAFLGQGQGYGRTTNRSMYFEDETMYSYGRHYPLARLVGDRTLLIRNRDSSVTTNKHNDSLHWAAKCEGFTVIRCDDVLAFTEDEHASNIANMRVRAHEASEKAKRARTSRNRDSHTSDEARELRYIEQYSDVIARSMVARGLKRAGRFVPSLAEVA